MSTKDNFLFNIMLNTFCHYIAKKILPEIFYKNPLREYQKSCFKRKQVIAYLLPSIE